MADSLAECQIEGCHKPAEYLVLWPEEQLYLCGECFCLLGRLKEAKGVVVIRNTVSRGRKSILGGKVK